MTTLPHAGEVFVERYQLHEVLGEGGFARVFRATDLDLGRDVALKLLKPAGDAAPSTAAERFQKEMKLLAAVRDPHIVTLFDYGQTSDGTMYMVLELVGGRDLSAVLAEGPLAEDDALLVMRQVLVALRAAHNAGMLHRDVKPANIRVYEYMGDPWRVKLLDFGIAKTLVDDAALTATGMAVGTPRFMTPEQLFGEELGPSTDLYSLAVVTCEMLTHEPLDHIRRVANDQEVLVTNERIREPVRDVLNRMLARRPSQRYPNADAVLAALDNLKTVETGARARTPVRGSVAEYEYMVSREPTTQRVEQRQRAPATVREHELESRSTTMSGAAAITPRLAALSGLAILTGVGAGILILAASGDDEHDASEAVTSRAINLPPAAPRVTTPRESMDVEEEPPAIERSGCGRRPPHIGTGVLDTTDGLRRVKWRVHVPADYERDTPHPTVLLLHDDTSDPQEVIDNTGLDEAADTFGFILVAPHDSAFTSVWMSDVIDDVQIAFEQTAAELCVDRDRVFAVGHGSGGNGVSRLTCQSWVHGFALASHIASKPRFPCSPTKPAPLIWFTPLNTGFQPPDGGKTCSGATKISFDEYEQLWRVRNKTRDEATVVHETSEGVCRRWDGEAPFVSCRVKGGRPWPGSLPRTTDVLDCDGKAPNFDYNGILLEFFSSLGR